MSTARVPLDATTPVLVTGGSGFLGRAIVERLLARAVPVASFARGAYPELEARGVRTFRGDLADAEAVRRACAGRAVVFHVAAKAGVWGPRDEFHRANVLGTRHVIDACRAAGVGRLVYTSTPSVVFAGRNLCGVDERAPYPDRYESAYPETKAIAERLVLDANGRELTTVSLRPHLVWGPGDPHFVPRITARARAGRLRIVGDGTNLVDTIFVDDAAEAHVHAAERLAPGGPLAGRAYFLSAGSPVPLWAMVNHLLAAAGLPPVERRIPAPVVYAAGVVLESLHRALGLRGEPLMTRFLARELATTHWFDTSAARRDLE
ncbi:MAG: NAD-dependent epimerase/dehydratase family protein, partial [Candidatus Binatia bacterium]